MDQIPIVMTTDDNYAFQISITLISIFEHKNEKTEYVFYVLNNGKLKINSKNMIEKVISKYKSKVVFLTVDTKKFQNVSAFGHVPIASFYRILISEMLPKIDRCLFIDGDTIIWEDLQELYLRDLKNNYLAGVKDCGIQYNVEVYHDYADKIGIPSLENYINAGILVMNLMKIREDGLVNEFILHMNKNYLMMDQDVINVCCYGKIEILPLEYNVFFDYYNQFDKLINTSFLKKEIESAKLKTKIIHFAGKYKPWNNIRCKNGNIWWDYAKLNLSKVVYEKFLENAKKWCEMRDFTYIIQNCVEKKEIIIFGYTHIGKMIYHGLENNDIKAVCAFCDNDMKKQGMIYDGLTVLNIDEVIEQFKNAFFIIASQGYYSQIREQLQDKGILEKNIIRYLNKNETYYDYLSEEYYEKEIKESLSLHFGNRLDKKYDIEKMIAKLKSGMKYEDVIKLYI